MIDPQGAFTQGITIFITRSITAIIVGDGSGQDVYVLGPDTPLETFDGVVIAVYHRTNDVEDKWIVATEGTDFSDEEILKNIFFVEQFFEGYLCR